MSFKHFVAALTVGLSVSTAAGVQAAEQEETRLAQVSVRVTVVPPVSTPIQVPDPKRPGILAVLYTTLGVMQAWDVYSTSAALNAGAKEANPTAAPFANKAGSMIGLKVVSTASSIFFAERMWKKNKVGAIVTMVVINGATSAVSMHNMRNAKIAASTR